MNIFIVLETIIYAIAWILVLVPITAMCSRDRFSKNVKAAYLLIWLICLGVGAICALVLNGDESPTNFGQNLGLLIVAALLFGASLVKEEDAAAEEK